jgi:protein-tyrosine-phosphatase
VSASSGRILVVCTANICRSPAAAGLLAAQLSDIPFRIDSAGVSAYAGARMCPASRALATAAEPSAADRFAAHASQPAARSQVRDADLVLALDRGHRAALVRSAPAARARIFTLREAAALAGPLATSTPVTLPDSAVDRLRWWVAELDAARHAQPPTPEPGPGRVHPHDVPDPHVVGAQYHPLAFDRIGSSVAALAASLSTVVGFVLSSAPFTLDEA